MSSLPAVLLVSVLAIGCGENSIGHTTSVDGGRGTGGSGAGGSSAGGSSGGGGSSRGGAEPVVEGTDPSPGEYATRADLPEANSEMAVAGLGDRIYVVGGYPSSREPQTTVQIYDVTADSWEIGPPVPEAVHHPVVVGAADKIYSLGGQLGTGDTGRTLVLDPTGGGGWTDLAPMPTPRGAGAGAVIGSVIYVVGGRPPAGNAFEAYDIDADSWTVLPSLPDAFPDRNHLAATAIDGKIYVAGGRHSGGSFASPMTDSVDVFDPDASAWSLAAPMPRPRGGVNGINAFGCFHVWGGEGVDTGTPTGVFPDHDVYNPKTDAWTSVAPMPTPVHGVTGAVFLDGVIYMPGGGTEQGGSSGSTIFQVYRAPMRCD